MHHITDAVTRINEHIMRMSEMLEEQLEGTRGMASSVGAVTDGSLQIDRALQEQHLALMEISRGIDQFAKDLTTAAQDSRVLEQFTSDTNL